MGSRFRVTRPWQDHGIAEQPAASLLVVCNISALNHSPQTELCPTRPRSFQGLRTYYWFPEAALVIVGQAYASKVFFLRRLSGTEVLVLTEPIVSIPK